MLVIKLKVNFKSVISILYSKFNLYIFSCLKNNSNGNWCQLWFVVMTAVISCGRWCHGDGSNSIDSGDVVVFLGYR